MSKLRQLARGQACQVRIPHVPCSALETVVLCHVRKGNIAGMGQKPPDLCAFYGCSTHHDLLDGRVHIANFSTAERNEAILHALLRTLVIVSKELKL